MFRIVIDARMYREAGVGRYIRNLLTNLEKIDHENEYFILLLKADYDTLVYHTKSFKKVLADFKWYGVSEQVKLPGILNKLQPDLVHFPHFNIPIFYRGKFVVTIHDLIHQNFQMRRATTRDPLTYRIKQLGYDTVFKMAIKKSEQIIVPSKYVKDQLINKWGVSADKLTVTHEAVDDKLIGEVSSNVLEKYHVKKPYILYAGNAHPHKNVEGLIKAFLWIKSHEMPKFFDLAQGEQVRHDNLSLVLVGGDHYFWQRIKKEYQQKDIIYTGFVSDSELAGLYKNAEVYVVPSFEEGFGIPLLEAMACGCPVVSSNAASLPEIGADAALYVDPYDIEDIARGIREILGDRGIRESLIKKGFENVNRFSWKKLAEQTLEVYESSTRS